MQPDLTPKSLEREARELAESLTSDAPSLWRPAYGAADAKQKMTLSEQLAQQHAADPPTAGAAAAAPAGDPAPERPATFLALVKGWLGRA